MCVFSYNVETFVCANLTGVCKFSLMSIAIVIAILILSLLLLVVIIIIIFFLVWSDLFLHAHCRFRGLLLHLIALKDTHAP